MTEKAKWTALLFCDLLLFLFALNINNYFLYFIVILLSLWIYKEGNPIIFKEYEERKKQKLVEYQKIKDSASSTVKSK